MFLGPVSDPKTRDRLGLMKTTYNLKKEPEITSAFYFDLALRSFLTVRDMLQSGKWQPNMKYISCDEYDGTNTPDRDLDLVAAFADVKEPLTYGNFSLATGGTVPFNGHSYMKFDMDISAVAIRGGASVNTKALGTWAAGLNSPLDIIATEDIQNLTADVVYRVYTVVVSNGKTKVDKRVL